MCLFQSLLLWPVDGADYAYVNNLRSIAFIAAQLDLEPVSMKARHDSAVSSILQGLQQYCSLSWKIYLLKAMLKAIKKEF